MRFISALNVSYPERLAQRPDAFKEFNRMFRELVRYALANRDEVFGAVGKQTNLPPEFFELVVREELRRARHVRRKPRPDHHEVLRAVEGDRDDPELSRYPHAWSGSTRCAPDGRDRHRACPIVASARLRHARKARRASVHAAVSRRLAGGVAGRAVLSAARPGSGRAAALGVRHERARSRPSRRVALSRRPRRSRSRSSSARCSR